MSDNGAGKAKAESSHKKRKAVCISFPKEKKSVMKMMGETAAKATSSFIDKTKNKNKTYPRD
ncbi:hypothetical protein Acr_04g0002860 [Actinidia rufa]|uniref:Uncharacterized protein n=1 Tax=Actinidia rufa TaxID=165716 RepID=A0A7J0EGE6_9ERIC|nr:hypothetical protein Acr_04g0002860 [Actinidia rufa]